MTTLARPPCRLPEAWFRFTQIQLRCLPPRMMTSWRCQAPRMPQLLQLSVKASVSVATSSPAHQKFSALRASLRIEHFNVFYFFIVVAIKVLTIFVFCLLVSYVDFYLFHLVNYIACVGALLYRVKTVYLN